ncbi:uncharacterized protein L3040_007584 [Drepanopeziza brunnea f. sp. 'multigermtubi']|uniref:Pectate lyase n=1 Tax=Marssonina brunnea f. sp. multigermtubi (strain MB_m1) TaxID=1072389 RepID=K1XZV5_MARBU|nr:pectate lyase [Drepanopeziza brunnea f. sp. 'multigermtubi' MB_m1]EKD18389.1 pectate lyase [Drepanopeziza brunnea f. sp. 'multigermtubi' MB_m1]KAJ5037409.1 hypothetical protein L3040_007584 [Drepanopeziza brunnea f. sp. 'multigermtubi']
MRYNIFLVVVAAAHSAYAATYYVSPTGSDTAAGTLAAPYRSIQLAVDKVVPGDTIFMRGGTYSLTTNIKITRKDGTSSARITLSAYNNEKVILDGEALPGTPSELNSSLPLVNRGVLQVLASSYWTFINFELINGPYGVFHANSSYNRYERLVTRENYESGFHMQGICERNTVLYLDSYKNRDPRRLGENADGFALKEGEGEGNLIKGVRVWGNSDDGLDLWEFRSGVTIEDSVSWGNGNNTWGFSPFNGDGNGFKLGGGDDGAVRPANHVVRNCISFQNVQKGFVDNGQTGVFNISRNSAWNNGNVGFFMESSTATLVDNLAVRNGRSEFSFTGGSQVTAGNTWQIAGTWNDAALMSTDSAVIKGPRDADGKIRSSNFLRPKNGAAVGAVI